MIESVTLADEGFKVGLELVRDVLEIECAGGVGEHA
jgi:hypothetical protein